MKTEYRYFASVRGRWPVEITEKLTAKEYDAAKIEAAERFGESLIGVNCYEADVETGRALSAWEIAQIREANVRCALTGAIEKKMK